MKRDKSVGSSSGSSGGGGGGGSRSGSSLSSDRPRPLSAFWGGLGKSSSPKSEPIAKGFKLKHSYGGSTGHLDAYGGMAAGTGGGGMRPAVSMPVVALPAGVSPGSRSANSSTTTSGSSGTNSLTSSTSSTGNNNSKHRHHRNSLPPLIPIQPNQRHTPNGQRPPSRALPSGLTSRMVKEKFKINLNWHIKISPSKKKRNFNFNWKWIIKKKSIK